MTTLNKKLNKKKDFYVPISLTLDQLDCMIIFILTDSILIKRKDLSRMQSLFNILEPSIYEKDMVIDMRYQFIKTMLEAKLKHNITEYSILMDMCIRANSYKDDLVTYIDDLADVDDLNEAEINYVKNVVNEYLNYSYLFKHKDQLADCLEELELGADSLYELNAKFKKVLTNLTKEMRQAKPDNEEEQDFDLSDEMLDSVLLDTARELKQPSNFLQTGIQCLNKMLNGGFEQDRQYTFFGISGVGRIF